MEDTKFFTRYTIFTFVCIALVVVFVVWTIVSTERKFNDCLAENDYKLKTISKGATIKEIELLIELYKERNQVCFKRYK